MFANTVSFIDRQILNLLVEPIKADLLLSDIQIATVQGLAFAIFYAAMGIPVGRIADLTSRKMIITVGAACWSVATIGCGFARSFWQLFAARVMVGVGESSVSPSGYALIADLFPREKMARPMGVFAGGIFIAAGLAYLVGGQLIDLAYQLSQTNIQIIGGMKPWALCFVLVGAPLGLILVLLLLTIKEPPRRDIGGPSNLSAKPRPGEVIEIIRARLVLFSTLFLGLSLFAMLNFGTHAWAPAFFIRKFGLPVSEVGLYIGLIMMTCGSAGVFYGGWFSDR